MHRRLIYVFFFILIFSECKKENSSPQWDIELIGPLAHARLGIGNLIGDSSIETMSNGAQVLNYDTTISQFNIDSIFEVADTTIPTVVLFPPIPAILHPGASFFSPTNNLTLGVSGVLLKQAIIYSGKIRLEIKNTLKSKVNFVYKIPKALKNGQQFLVTASVDSGSITDPKYFTGEYDFSGYSLDLTGTTGNSFNSISYNVDASANSPGYDFPVNGLDTIVNLKTTLVDIQPSYVKGYLGQVQSNEVTTQNSGLGEIIKNGIVQLDSVKFNLDIINYIGADAQAYINYFKSQNSRTGTTIDLVAPSFLQRYLNVNRATINPALTDSLVPSYYSIQLDNNNSNIKALVENLPESFIFDLNLNLNPLGNISGSNDFVFRDKLIDTRIRIRMPLNFAADQLILADTFPFTIADATNFDPVGPTTLTLIADNGFPFDLNAQMFLLDSTHTVVDSMIVPDLIKAAPVDMNYRATGIERTNIIIPIDEARKHRLLTAEQAGIRLQFNTPDYPQLIQMYSDYHLDLKIVADGKYSIR